MPPKPPAAGDSIIFTLQTLFKFFKVKGTIPPQFRNMTALNKFMKSDKYQDKHNEFMKFHLSMIDHDPDRNIEDTQMLGEKKRSVVFKELCTLINSIIGISHIALPIIRLKKLTVVVELLDEDNQDCYILQVTWNRETEQTMNNLKGTNARSLRIYRKHVKVCNDEVSLTDEYDDQFTGLLFFIGSHIMVMGQASHIKTPKETLPIHADQLFNVGETETTAVSIEAIYKVIITEEKIGLGQLVSPYNLSLPVASVPPSPALESSAIAAASKRLARRAPLSSEIQNIPIDGEGFEDVNAFWQDLTAQDSSASGWPVGADPPDSEVHTVYNLVTMSAELAEAATKATKAAEDEAAAKLAQEKAAAAAVLADAEVTKAANIAALAAEAATKGTKAAENEAAAKLAQEKAATAAVLADAEVTKAANIVALAAEAATNATNATNATKATKATKAAEDETAAKLAQEKAATEQLYWLLQRSPRQLISRL
eukprot:scaffold207578_cov67-Attheya_sp.AAC.1